MVDVLLRSAVLGFLLLLFAGCTSVTPPVRTSQPPATQPPPPPQVPKPGEIVETQTGRVIPFETLIGQLSNVQVVYVGETHMSREDHRIELEVLKGLYNQNPSLALAMEMFPREAQPVLDRFSKGMLSDRKFLKEVKWEQVWGYPFALYQPILDFARDKHLPILGLNAPRNIVSKVARTGLASLSPQERSHIAHHFDLNDTERRDTIRKEYEEHLKGEIKNFDTFFEAQLTWEDTMAETLARAVTALKDGERLLVLIGNGHIMDRQGVPKYTAERVQNTYRTIIPLPVDQATPPIDPRIGDYVWITEKAEAPPHGRLGILIRPLPAGKGLEVLEVIPGSPAEKAGVQKGDVLDAIDSIPIKDIGQIHKAFAKEASGTHRLEIKRKGRKISLTVSLPAQEDGKNEDSHP